jgi:hypothetical protein
MNKQTKTLLTIGGVAVVGYILYKQFAQPKSNFVSSRIPPTKKIKVNYVAGGYDSGYQGGAQWISLGGTGGLGYWYPCESASSGFRPCYTQGEIVGYALVNENTIF